MIYAERPTKHRLLSIFPPTSFDVVIRVAPFTRRQWRDADARRPVVVFRRRRSLFGARSRCWRSESPVAGRTCSVVCGLNAEPGGHKGDRGKRLSAPRQIARKDYDNISASRAAPQWGGRRTARLMREVYVADLDFNLGVCVCVCVCVYWSPCGERWSTSDWPGPVIDQWSISDRPVIDQWSTSDRPLIDQWALSHWPVIDQWLTSDRPVIDQWSTSDWPVIDQWSTSNHWWLLSPGGNHSNHQ